MSELSSQQQDLLGGIAKTPFYRVIAGANKDLYGGFDREHAVSVFRDAVGAGATEAGEVSIYQDNQLMSIEMDTDGDLSSPAQGTPESIGIDESVDTMYAEMDAEEAELQEASRVDMKRDVEEVAKGFYRKGVVVEINDRLPWVSVKGPGVDWFAQGEDASEFIEEAQVAATKFSVDPQDWILFTLDSGGAI